MHACCLGPTKKEFIVILSVLGSMPNALYCPTGLTKLDRHIKVARLLPWPIVTDYARKVEKNGEYMVRNIQ